MDDKIKLIKLNNGYLSPRHKKNYIYPRNYAIKKNTGFSKNVNSIIEKYKKTLKRKKLKAHHSRSRTKKMRDLFKYKNSPKKKLKDTNYLRTKETRHFKTRPKIKFQNTNSLRTKEKQHFSPHPKIKFQNTNSLRTKETQNFRPQPKPVDDNRLRRTRTKIKNSRTKETQNSLKYINSSKILQKKKSKKSQKSKKKIRYNVELNRDIFKNDSINIPYNNLISYMLNNGFLFDSKMPDFLLKKYMTLVSYCKNIKISKKKC